MFLLILCNSSLTPCLLNPSLKPLGRALTKGFGAPPAADGADDELGFEPVFLFMGFLNTLITTSAF